MNGFVKPKKIEKVNMYKKKKKKSSIVIFITGFFISFIMSKIYFVQRFENVIQSPYLLLSMWPTIYHLLFQGTYITFVLFADLFAIQGCNQWEGWQDSRFT